MDWANTFGECLPSYKKEGRKKWWKEVDLGLGDLLLLPLGGTLVN